MAYLAEITEPLIRTLRHFVTLPDYQFAGHVANSEFWMDEFRHAVNAIDGYRVRFDRMKKAQVDLERSGPLHNLSANHGGMVNGPALGYDRPPRHMPDEQRKDLRRDVLAAAGDFIDRAVSCGLMTSSQASAWLARRLESPQSSPASVQST